MLYNYYEVLLLTILIASLVLKVTKKLFNILMFLTITFLLLSIKSVNVDIVSWEPLVKIFCVLIGVVIINSNRTKTFDSSNILILCVILASMLMLSTTNMLALYLCIELQSLSIFILIAQEREFAYRIEASLKYFVLSSISSGLLLLGSSLLFIHSGNCEITTLVIQGYTPEKTLILVALLFKLAASPFHFWSPDVYQGSNNNTLLLLGTLPKVSVLGVFIVLFPGNKLVLGATILSLIIGCVGAINQSKIKRLLAYSGIVGIGFILLGVSIGSYQGIEAGAIYMAVYAVTFVSILILVSKSIDEKPTLGELSSLLGSNLVILSTFGVMLLSVAGIPPLGGFFSKWLVLTSAVTTEFIFSSILSVLCAIIAGVYYIRLVKIGYFQEEKTFLIWRKVLIKEKEVEFVQATVLGMLLYSITFILVCPQILWKPVHYGVLSLF